MLHRKNVLFCFVSARDRCVCFFQFLTQPLVRIYYSSQHMCLSFFSYFFLPRWACGFFMQVLSQTGRKYFFSSSSSSLFVSFFWRKIFGVLYTLYSQALKCFFGIVMCLRYCRLRFMRWIEFIKRKHDKQIIKSVYAYRIIG